LKSKGIFCCGTVKSTRKYLPKLELDKNMTMGDMGIFHMEFNPKQCTFYKIFALRKWFVNNF